MEKEKINAEIIYAEDLHVDDPRNLPWMAQLMGDTPPTKSFYSIHWVLPDDRLFDPKRVGHPPHIHKETEIMFLLGTDPDNHLDLGAEVEFSFGDKMEKHVITKTCSIIIPGGTPHGFYRVKKTTRPWVFIQAQEAVPRTEKFLWDYLTQEQIDNLAFKEKWVDTGFDD